MSSYFTDHEYMPCARCGVSLSQAERGTHICDAQRRARFEAFQLRQELAEFDRELAAFLGSPAGQFAVYCAERDRRRDAQPNG
jgi:hypothetical protein